jgi:hypothetical protein
MLSGEDITNFFNTLHVEGPLVLRYDEIKWKGYKPNDFYSNLIYTPVVILYPGYSDNEFTPFVGHWTCLFCDHNKEINFFDSFGRLPDTMFSTIHDMDKYHYKKLIRYLEFVHQSLGVPIHYNDKQFQTLENSCGKWTCLRVYLKDKTADEFEEKMRSVESDPRTSTITKIYALLTSE